jgi:glutamate/tyrosine decarboxylase-like PLP-dependent enzyme
MKPHNLPNIVLIKLIERNIELADEALRLRRWQIKNANLNKESQIVVIDSVTDIAAHRRDCEHALAVLKQETKNGQDE